MNELTALQEAFADAYVRNGGNATKAAVEAGYSKRSAASQASQILKLEHVQRAVRSAAFSYIERLAPLAVDTLVEVMKDLKVAPRDRIVAANALLDRGYLIRGTKSEVAVQDSMTGAKLIARVAEQRAKRLENDLDAQNQVTDEAL